MRPRITNSAATAVLTSDALVRRITEFQSGYPHAVAGLLVGVDSTGLQHAWGRVFSSQKTLDGALPRLVVAVGDTRTLRLLFDLKARPPYQNDPMVAFTHVMRSAVQLKRVDMLECLAELMARDPNWRWEPNLLARAVDTSEGDVRVLEWLHAHLPHESRDIGALYVNGAAYRGDLRVLRWICEHGYRNIGGTADCAAANEHVEVLEYLYQHTDVRCSPGEVTLAAERGAVEVVKIVVREQTAEALEQALGAASRHGRLEVVRFFVERGVGANAKTLIDVAAQEGHLSVVTYLHEHLPRACTWQAMHNAALRSHVDIVAFLHAHRTEGCSPATMNSAAAHGHLNVVRFLHEHRSEGCTTKAMDGAAAGGRLEIVQFLHANRSEGCSSAAVHLAAVNGHFAVMEFLCEHRPECDAGALMMSAASGGHLDVVKRLHKFPAARASAFVALRAAAQQRRPAVLQFLCQQHREQAGATRSSFLAQAITDGTDWLVEALVPHSTAAELEDARAIACGRAEGEPPILRVIERRIDELMRACADE